MAETVKSADEVKTAVEGVTFQQVLESYGDSRATEASTTAVKNYETKYGLKDGKEVKVETKPTEEVTNTEDMPPWAKQLLESNKQLSDTVKSMQGEKLTTDRKQKLAEIINRLPENLRKGYERISVSDMKEEDFDKLIGEITTEVEGIEKDVKSKGLVFGHPASTSASGSSKQTSTTEATDEEANAVVDKLLPNV
ncbi:MAG: hypothetical protein SPJ13_01345 [Bacteroidales bacterium]|nr:hypothetical protein [Bacteroidales bacterium]